MKKINNASNNLSVCIAVWGQEFIETFLNYSLSSILSENNIPFISNETKIYISIYTDKNGYKIIQQSKYFIALKEHANINFFLINGVSIVGNYIAMNDCHRHFISNNINKSLMILCPDMIYSDGSLKKLYYLHRNKSKVVCIFTPRLDKKNFLLNYDKKIQEYGKLALNNKDLIDLALKNFHPETLSTIIDDGIKKSTESGGFFLKDPEGLIGCNFHYYPIIFKSDYNTILPRTTIDNDFLDKNIVNYQDIIVVNKAIECCIIDITDINRTAFILNEHRSINTIVKWASNNTGNIHKKLFDEVYHFRKTAEPISIELRKKIIYLQTEIQNGILEVENKIDLMKAKPIFPKFLTILKQNSIFSILKKIFFRAYMFLFGGLIIKSVK